MESMCKSQNINIYIKNKINYIALNKFITNIIKSNNITSITNDYNISYQQVKNMNCITIQEAERVYNDHKNGVVVRKKDTYNGPVNLFSQKLQYMLTYEDKEISIINDNGSYWFRGKDLALILGYENTEQCIRVNIKDKNKKKLEEIGQNTMYINESGLYSLIGSSKKKKAEDFKEWVFDDILPELRKNGIVSTIKQNNLYKTTYDINDYENMKLIYILKILFEENTYYKVGMTNNILSRVTGLYEIYGFFEILYLMKTENNIEVES